MNKKNRKTLVCAMLCTILSNIWIVSPSYAIAAKAEIVTESKDEINAITFKDRIQKILDDYHKELEKKAFQPSKKNIDENATQNVHSPNLSQIRPEIREELKATYDFDWRGTPLAQTLYTISKISGKRVVLNGELSGNVYTSLYGVTYEQALNYLSKTFNFNWMLDEDGDAILISTSNLMLQNKIFTVHYADKDKLKEELKSLGIEDKNIYVNNENGSISVTGTPYQLYQADRRIVGVDKPAKQCLIIAQLIELSHGKDINLGFKYDLPTYTHSAGEEKSMSGNFIDKLTFSSSVQANKALSRGKVIARPMIMTINGQEASIYMGDNVPVLTTTATSSSTSVTVEYKEVGTNLKVTPYINTGKDDVRLKIDTDVSNISKWITSGSISAPQISSRKAQTIVTLQSGQSFVIGGLMTVNELDNLSGIPGLMELPILGRLFKHHSTSKTYSEVFIMITPYIVSEDIDPQALLKMSKEVK